MPNGRENYIQNKWSNTRWEWKQCPRGRRSTGSPRKRLSEHNLEPEKRFKTDP
jgi:hypothetical protein